MNYPLEEIILPMGATTVKEVGKLEEIWESPEYIAETKYDGSRYLSVGGRFFSRKISVKTNYPVEKTDNVPHLQVMFNKYPLLILDGEVYIQGGNSNQVTSIMGAGVEKALARQVEQGNLRYMVYDILRGIDGEWLTDLPWIERRAVLEQQMEAIFADQVTAKEYVGLSNYVVENKKEFNAEIMRRGGEGVMLKHIHGKYHPDKKPRWNWIKVKQEITSDVIITGFKDAKRLYEGDELPTWQYWQIADGEFVLLDGEIQASVYMKEHHVLLEPVKKFHFYGWIGAVEFSQYNKTGELIQVGYCSGINETLRQEMTEHPFKYLGECMEISAMERTKDGYFRHPQYLCMRPDKNQKDCVIGED